MIIIIIKKIFLFLQGLIHYTSHNIIDFWRSVGNELQQVWK